MIGERFKFDHLDTELEIIDTWGDSRTNQIAPYFLAVTLEGELVIVFRSQGNWIESAWNNYADIDFYLRTE